MFKDEQNEEITLSGQMFVVSILEGRDDDCDLSCVQCGVAVADPGSGGQAPYPCYN